MARATSSRQATRASPESRSRPRRATGSSLILLAQSRVGATRSHWWARTSDLAPERLRALGEPVDEVFVALCHEPGREAEVDWGCASVVIAGVLRRCPCS